MARQRVRRPKNAGDPRHRAGATQESPSTADRRIAAPAPAVASGGSAAYASGWRVLVGRCMIAVVAAAWLVYNQDAVLEAFAEWVPPSSQWLASAAGYVGTARARALLVTLCWLAVALALRPCRKRRRAPRGVALVTGASSGIGLEIARLLASDGHDLVLVARREAKLRQVAAELAGLDLQAQPAGESASSKSPSVARSDGDRNRRDIRVSIVVADLAQPGAAKALYDRVTGAGPGGLGLRVDYLVNNAGFGYTGDLTAAPASAAATATRRSGTRTAAPRGVPASLNEGMLMCNVVNLQQLTQLFVTDMVARGRGKILNVASTAGMQPVPAMATYAASKAFIHNFTIAIGHELAKRRVAQGWSCGLCGSRSHFTTRSDAASARDGGSSSTNDDGDAADDATFDDGVTATSLVPGATHTEFEARAGMRGSWAFRLPGFASPATLVARRGYDAWMSGDAWCVPGVLDWACAVLSSMAPYAVTNVISAALMAAP